MEKLPYSICFAVLVVYDELFKKYGKARYGHQNDGNRDSVPVKGENFKETIEFRDLYFFGDLCAPHTHVIVWPQKNQN